MIDVYCKDNPTFGSIRVFVDESIKMIYLAGIDVCTSLGYKCTHKPINHHVPECETRMIYYEEINPIHRHLLHYRAHKYKGITPRGVFYLLDKSRLKNEKILEYQEYIRSIALPYSTFSKNSIDNGRFANLLR